MSHFTEVEISHTLKVINSTIHKCKKIQPKFNEGTSQHTLLKNRLNALYVSKSLIENTNNYTKEELEKALPPILSIIHKCTKAMSKYEIGSTQYNRMKPTVDAMEIAKFYIEEKTHNNNE